MMRMSKSLSKNQLKYLRGLCHHLQPVVTVADKGLSDNVVQAIHETLADHELIKVKLRAERDQRAVFISKIENETGAHLVQKIGQVACFYLQHPEEPKLALPSG